MTCRACGHHTTEVMDFGTVALAGAFLKPEDFKREEKHPLTLRFCEKCLLLQTGENIAPKTLFQQYYYFSSATETMRKHFERYASELVAEFAPRKVLEIGCNDGVLIRPLQKLGVDVVGVDPAENVTPSDLPIVNAYWGDYTTSDRFDLILANNVFAHISDISAACENIERHLTDGGSFIFEVNRLDSMIADLQYDWVYHEHLFYYSLLALDNLLSRHGLMIYHLKRLGTHAGSARYYACKKGAQMPTRAVESQRNRELWHGLHQVGTYRDFALLAAEHRDDLRDMIEHATTVAGYGACGRTNTMLQWCGLTQADVQYIVDDAPAKQGLYTPGTHIPIVGRESLGDPDMLVVFAWSFLNEIQPKLADYRGAVVVPLPHIYTQKQRLAA